MTFPVLSDNKLTERIKKVNWTNKLKWMFNIREKVNK